jgi:glutamyl-tRNA synthetase
MSSTVVTRFAPSPTGYLHIGGARTALFNWLLARSLGGKFLLRIEDTDLARSTEQAAAQLLADLKWLGLHWDNPELVYQSKRTAIYNALIDRLIAEGKAYKAYESSEELDALRKQAEREKRAFIYRRRDIPQETLRQYESEGRPHVVRFAMPVRDYSFRDVVLDKDVVQPAAQVQDFVIRKTDGMPTYHFAVVVDDAEMGVTHILRGQEHTLNTINHIALQEALGYPRPTYGHLPIILNADGSKMGKRDRDKKVRLSALMWLKNKQQTPAELARLTGLAEDRLNTWLEQTTTQLDIPEHQRVMAVVGLKESDLPEILVNDFRKNGYVPEVLLNFLALMGWSPGGDREQMSIAEMTQLFAIAGIGKSNARFARDKLMSFNTDFCAKAPLERLIPAMRDYLAANPESPLNRACDAQLGELIDMKRGFRTLREVDEKSAFMLLPDDAVTYDPAAVEKVLRKQEGFAVLTEMRPILAGLADWTLPAIDGAINAYCQQKNLGMGKVAQPIRVAVSGGTISPPIGNTLAFLGKEATLRRIDKCLAAKPE